jgi:hypothetical protein
VTPFVAVLGALLALLVPLAFVAGLRLGELRSSSKLAAATSTLKAASAVSAIAQQAATRSAQDWTLAQKITSTNTVLAETVKSLDRLTTICDRMDVTLAKVAEWTVMAPGRKRIHAQQDPVDAFISRSQSLLPSVPLYPEAEEGGLARPAASSERGQP